ncbi:hypothetical protein U472_00620 [Orenia metallireducens]|uniref:Uncharacterized protein n=1 Tax=Orenia metallireducens TaxID=1413210 RepID=A0A1C0ADB6_9FIRM|nr:IS3 family transposase [Orenia metallireducens]OCL28604.1 hypothetical protein U472_00620 [Orenia metallireducens]
MASTGKRYNEDFKQMIIEFYQSGKSKSELSREYGVSRTSIDNWIELYTEIDIDEDTTVTYKELLAIKKENERLQEDIMDVYLDSHKRYGAIKIHKKLSDRGWDVSIKRVQRLMKKLDIGSIVHKKFKHYPSKSDNVCGENLLERDFSTTSVNQKWVSDITYIYTIQDGWCYLASFVGLYESSKSSYLN